MYTNQAGYATAGYATAAPQLAANQAVNPSVSGTHQAAISQLLECVAMADGLLAKVRGAQPHEQDKSPAEMPSVMANAAMINSLAAALAVRLKELHEIIGG